jgi:phosphoglucosamine mutase
MIGSRLFGTDGIRGPFGSPPLDRETVHRLGLALGQHLTRSSGECTVLLAGDTRDSTPQICTWLAESLWTSGCDIVFAGVLPSPAVSRLVVDQGYAAGIAVSASHNPHPDNGIKLIAPDGSKWDPVHEKLLERDLLDLTLPDIESLQLAADSSLSDRYLGMLADLAGRDKPLQELRVTLDSSNGAAAGLADSLFTQLGATVTSLGDQPNGSNINDGCGSTHPEAMAAATAASNSHVGFAFDGDADRVVFADELGTVHDGDSILFLLGSQMYAEGTLRPPKIVATSMSNLGLEVALEERGIELLRCDVGDRVVVRTLRQEGLILGGEQSGHIIHLGLGATGDGLQTALLISKILMASDRPASALLSDFRTFPQILLNVPVASKPDLSSLPAVREAADQVDAALASHGRLVLRYSGTESLARVMIEGPDQAEIESLAQQVAGAIRDEIGT